MMWFRTIDGDSQPRSYQLRRAEWNSAVEQAAALVEADQPREPVDVLLSYGTCGMAAEDVLRVAEAERDGRLDATVLA